MREPSLLSHPGVRRGFIQMIRKYGAEDARKLIGPSWVSDEEWDELVKEA